MRLSDPSIAQEIADALLDEYSRKIMLSLIDYSKSIEEISEEENIPISTCYRRIHVLLHRGMVKACETVLQKDGKKYIKYRAIFKNVSLQIDSSKMAVDAIPNTDGDAGRTSCLGCSPIQLPDEDHRERTVRRPEAHISEVLGLKSKLPVLKDCDFCSSQSVWCNAYTTGDSNATIFVCAGCQFKRVREVKHNTKDPGILA